MKINELKVKSGNMIFFEELILNKSLDFNKDIMLRSE